MTQWVDGLAPLASLYDGYVVDQFGVLHDGVVPYAGAAQALAELKARGQRVIVLSNSGKRATVNAQRLARFGVTPAHYDALITSGELMWQMLHRRDREPFSSWGHRVWLGCPQEDAATLDGLDLVPVSSVTEAEFVLLASLPDEAGAADALQAPLDVARARGLPVLCANPDRHRLTSRGVERSTGSLAADYEAAGGAVVWLGKPYPLIYTVCREALGRWGSRHFVAIGDSLLHDIGGGAQAGYDTCFVAGGLHANDFAASGDGAAHQVQLARLLRQPEAQGVPAPTWALPRLQWTATPQPTAQR